MIEIEEQAKAIALKKFESLEELDKQIEPFLSNQYKKVRFFLRVLMMYGSTELKTLLFHSEVVSKFIKENETRLNSDTMFGSDSLVDKIYEDDSSIFYIDLFPWKDKIQFPFRNLTNYKEFINLGKRIIFYDVDYKWREITNDENITDYIGWTPEDQLKLYLITMALTN